MRRYMLERTYPSRVVLFIPDIDQYITQNKSITVQIIFYYYSLLRTLPGFSELSIYARLASVGSNHRLK